MITPDITIDIDGATAHLTDVERRQVPFAASKALNTLVKLGQQAVRQGLDARGFTIAPSRRRFLEQLVRIPRGGWATKQNLAVRLDVSQGERSTGKDRSHVLGRHEAGGTRHAESPLKPYFIPTKELRPGPHDLPPRALYPTALRLIESRGVVGFTVDAKSKRRAVHGTLGIKSKVTARGVIQIQGKRRTFVMGSHDGRMRQVWGVWQRTGPGEDDIRPLWWFRLRVTLKPRLSFVPTIQAVVDRNWAPTFATELEAALRTAR